jgi:hypothetical protein
MKKTILFLVILALAVPATALAATEFSLGGFIKLDSFWDSTQQGKNMNGTIARNNDPNFHHGRMKFTAQGSRFNFTIKGPKLFGAQTTGFIEMDFDNGEAGPNAAGLHAGGNAMTASNSYTPRLRHAMFRLNWPETELLFGQYWSMFCEWYPEVAEDGPFQVTGIPTARLAQIRLTQKFLGDWTVAALIGEGSNVAPGALNTYSANDTSGESAEQPQLQGKIQYQHDWWGKAPYYGKPIPFTAQFVGGWQRTGFRPQAALALRPGWQQDPVAAAAIAGNVQHQYVNPFLLNATLFIPVLPTYSANVAGTASILANWWIGQGVEAFGFGGNTSQVFSQIGQTGFFDVELLKRYGGFVQGQYYFNNEWFVTAAWAMTKAYGVSQDLGQIGGRATAFAADQFRFQQQVDLCLWYRPIQAIKFGLQYSFGQTYWFQRLGAGAAGVNARDHGEAHRVEFVGFFYF